MTARRPSRNDIERVRRAPEILAQVRADIVTLGERLPPPPRALDARPARAALQRSRRCDRSPRAPTRRSSCSRSRRTARTCRRGGATDGRREEANLALETATEAVRRAAAIIDGVEDFEIEALRAESTLADVIADSRGDLVAARDAPQVPAVTAAVGRARSRHSRRSRRRASEGRPVHRSSRTCARPTARLDAAIAVARERAARPIPSLPHVRHALDDADRQIAVARNVIAGHRGWIGADARTRLAEAERSRIGRRAPRATDEDSREEDAMALARRVRGSGERGAAARAARHRFVPPAGSGLGRASGRRTPRRHERRDGRHPGWPRSSAACSATCSTAEPAPARLGSARSGTERPPTGLGRASSVGAQGLRPDEGNAPRTGKGPHTRRTGCPRGRHPVRLLRLRCVYATAIGADCVVSEITP